MLGGHTRVYMVSPTLPLQYRNDILAWDWVTQLLKGKKSVFKTFESLQFDRRLSSIVAETLVKFHRQQIQDFVRPYNKMIYWISKQAPISNSLQLHHNEHHGSLNNQRLDCLLSRCFRRRSKKTSKLRVTGLCAGNSQVTSEFLPQKATNTENVSIWWRHHVGALHCLT